MRPKRRAYTFKISGFTRDETGLPLGGCFVRLYRTLDGVLVAETTSDGLGAYEFTLPSSADSYYATAYKIGSPAVAGIAVDLTV